jgi:hypothetical protein
MRAALLLLILSSSPIVLPLPALAQTSPTSADPVVTGDNRVSCRRVTRTATRMRTGRICRTQSQWTREAPSGPVPSEPSSSIDGASDSIETAGDKISTDDIGGIIGPSGVTGVGPY